MVHVSSPSKGQCRNSKIFLPLVLVIKVVQNIFFPETYNASTFLSLDSRCELCRQTNCLQTLIKPIKEQTFWETHAFKHQKFALQLELQVHHYTSLPFCKTNIWITQDNDLGSIEVCWAKRTNIWGNKCLPTPKDCSTILICKCIIALVYQLVRPTFGLSRTTI